MDFNIFLGGGGGGFRKMFFCGMKILWIFFGGHNINGLVLGAIFMHFMVFSEGQCTEWGYFSVAKISNIFLGMPDIPNIF